MMSPDLPIVRCAGGPRQRGQAHGEALRGLVQATLERWLATLQRVGWPDPQSYVRDFLHQTEYAAALARWTPDLLDEIRGIAEGAAVLFDNLFAYNLLDEEWWFARNHTSQAPGCTVIGWRAAAGDPPLLAQTMDIGNIHLRRNQPGAHRPATAARRARATAQQPLHEPGL